MAHNLLKKRILLQMRKENKVIKLSQAAGEDCSPCNLDEFLDEGEGSRRSVKSELKSADTLYKRHSRKVDTGNPSNMDNDSRFHTICPSHVEGQSPIVHTVNGVQTEPLKTVAGPLEQPQKSWVKSRQPDLIAVHLDKGMKGYETSMNDLDQTAALCYGAIHPPNDFYVDSDVSGSSKLPVESQQESMSNHQSKPTYDASIPEKECSPNKKQVFAEMKEIHQDHFQFKRAQGRLSPISSVELKVIEHLVDPYIHSLMKTCTSTIGDPTLFSKGSKDDPSKPAWVTQGYLPSKWIPTQSYHSYPATLITPREKDMYYMDSYLDTNGQIQSVTHRPTGHFVHSPRQSPPNFHCDWQHSTTKGHTSQRSPRSPTRDHSSVQPYPLVNIAKARGTLRIPESSQHFSNGFSEERLSISQESYSSRYISSLPVSGLQVAQPPDTESSSSNAHYASTFSSCSSSLAARADLPSSHPPEDIPHFLVPTNLSISPPSSNAVFGESLLRRASQSPSESLPQRASQSPSESLPQWASQSPSESLPQRSPQPPLESLPQRASHSPSESLPQRASQSPSGSVPQRASQSLLETLLQRASPSPSESLSQRVSQSTSESLSQRASQSPSESVPQRASQSPSEFVPQRASQSPSESLSQRASRSPSETLPQRASQSPSESLSQRASRSPSESLPQRASRSPSESLSQRASRSPSESLPQRASQSQSESLPLWERQSHLSHFQQEETHFSAIESPKNVINALPTNSTNMVPHIEPLIAFDEHQCDTEMSICALKKPLDDTLGTQSRLQQQHWSPQNRPSNITLTANTLPTQGLQVSLQNTLVWKDQSKPNGKHKFGVSLGLQKTVTEDGSSPSITSTVCKSDVCGTNQAALDDCLCRYHSASQPPVDNADKSQVMDSHIDEQNPSPLHKYMSSGSALPKGQEIKLTQCDVECKVKDMLLDSKLTSSGRNKGSGQTKGLQYSCQVCGDVAAGFHCGAFVCEACKKFYLRCLKNGSPVLTCPRNRQCYITKDNRSHCQYCRYQKCSSLNMYRPGREDEKKLKVNFQSIPCKVCSAASSGFHFGAITCEGCKGFFRRMLKMTFHQKFHCSDGNNCSVNKTNRTACKSCRFHKCLQVGMKLEGTRLGRQSNSVKRSTLVSYQMETFERPQEELVPPSSSELALGSVIQPTVKQEPMSPEKEVPFGSNSKCNVLQELDAQLCEPKTSQGESLSVTSENHGAAARSCLNGRLPPADKYPASIPFMPKASELCFDSPPSLQLAGNSSPSGVSRTGQTCAHGAVTLHPTALDRLLDLPASTVPEEAMDTWAPMSSPIPPSTPTSAAGTASSLHRHGTLPVTCSDVHQLFTNSQEIINTVSDAYQVMKNIMDQPRTVSQYSREDSHSAFNLAAQSFNHHAKIILKFIKQIPGFRMLTIENQVLMSLESLYPLALIHHSQYYDGQTGKASFFINAEKDVAILSALLPPFHYLQEHFVSTGYLFHQLQLDDVERALLSALYLFSQEAKDEHSNDLFRAFQEEWTQLLLEYTDGKEASRGPRLLARLPELTRANMDHKDLAAIALQLDPSMNFGALWEEVFSTRPAHESAGGWNRPYSTSTLG